MVNSIQREDRSGQITAAQFLRQRTAHRGLEILFLPLCSALAFCLLAVCAVAAIAQTGADASSISAIQAALHAGDNEQALTLVHTQLGAWPKDVRLWTLEGIALAHLGRNREALIAYNKALTISPDYLAALEGAAELEYKAGSSRAVALLNRILKLRPDEPTTHAMLASLAYKKHDCVGAVEHFRKSGPVLSAQPSALEEYGACLMDLQKARRSAPRFPANPRAAAKRSARALQPGRGTVHRAAQRRTRSARCSRCSMSQRTRPRRSGPGISSLRRDRRHAARSKSAAASDRRKPAQGEVLRRFRCVVVQARIVSGWRRND